MTFVRNNMAGIAPVFAIEWRVGVYVRLSKEDGDKTESNSIQNQKRIIEDHLKSLSQQGERIASVEIYQDDGYSGGNFNRPDYQRMISDIEVRKINCVIFKDNSRLGRNYPELGRLMEDYFPQLGVRVISVLNNLDSVKDPRGYCSAIVSFSNIVNDDYIRQLSIKIKSTLKMKRDRGEFIGNYAPYGYIKSAEDRHKLSIDPDAARVIKMIFDWYADGVSASGIVKRLNSMHIDPPSVYKMKNGCKGFSTHSSGGAKRNIWAITSVNTILRDEVYIGNTVQGKNKSQSYRSKKMVPTNESEWIVVEGTHEPIISDEKFTIVHNRIMRHTRVAPNNKATYILSGYIRCAYCGRRMSRCISNGVARYRCPTRSYASDKCACPSVKESHLEDVILETIQVQINELVNAKAVMDSAWSKIGPEQSIKEYTSLINRSSREIERLESVKFQLYDDYRSGLISKSDFALFQRKYDDAISGENETVRQLRQELSELKFEKKHSDDFVSYFEKYGNIQRLDREVMNQLIDHVEFWGSDHIEIYFKFSDECERLLSFADNIGKQQRSREKVC